MNHHRPGVEAADKVSPFSALEEHRLPLIAALLFCCALIIAVTSLRNPGDYDLWWHLRMGMDWLENGLSPWQDHYSFTYLGESIANPPVVFQAVFWQMTDWFGERNAQVLFKLLAHSSVLVLMLLWLKRLAAPVWVYALVLPLLVSALQIRVMVRPELISYSFMLVALLLYERSQLRLTARAMLPVVGLLALWSLYHSPIFGYVIFFGLFVDIALRLLRERAPLSDWLAWAGWGLLALLAGFVNRELSHSVLETLVFTSSVSWGDYILEYRPTWEGLSKVALAGRIVPYLLLLSAVLAAVLALLHKRIGYLIIVVVFTWFGITMNRMVTPAAIVCLAILAHLLCLNPLPKRLAAAPDHAQRAMLFVLAAIIGFTLYNSVRHARFYLAENAYSWARFPEAMIDHMVANDLQGNIFNVYQMGGFLLYHLAPESKVYIDGRTGILYPWEHAMRHQAAVSSDQVFLEEVARYDIEFAVLEGLAANAEFMSSAGFELEFSDVSYALFRRQGGAFPELGTFWAKPYCWTTDQRNRLIDELVQAERVMPRLAAVRPLTVLTAGYLEASDKAAFLAAYPQSQLASVSSIRFFAYRAMDAGAFALAARALSRLTDPAPKDQLALMLALLRAGDVQASMTYLEQALAGIREWQNVEPIDLVILKGLIDELSRQQPLTFIEPGLRDELEQTVGGASVPLAGADFTSAAFCGAR